MALEDSIKINVESDLSGGSHVSKKIITTVMLFLSLGKIRLISVYRDVIRPMLGGGVTNRLENRKHLVNVKKITN